ncbi:MAG TPA: hypothetical protein DHV86_03445 [Methylophilaceae bacterium]|nr:hypothetical protein [Methylophilaceae bacterium]
MTNKNLNPFDLNRTEYAKELGITPNAVRMRMRRGQLEGEYKFENGKYNFRAPERARVSMVNNPGQMTTSTKRIINRGAHETSKNPRYTTALRNRNEAVKLASLKYKVSDKIQSLLPRAIELAEKENRELLEKKTTSLNNYNSRGLKVRGQSSLNIDYNPRPTVHKPFRGYDSIGTDYDDGSVEVDVSRYSGGSVISEPRFESKVAESIWRLKNKK